MLPTSHQQEQRFAEAIAHWNIEALVADLSVIKGRALNTTETQLLLGLLCGYKPVAMAEMLYQSRAAVRVTLHRKLYRYIAELLLQRTGEEVKLDWSRIPYLLEKIGYRTQLLNLSAENQPTLNSWQKAV